MSAKQYHCYAILVSLGACALNWEYTMEFGPKDEAHLTKWSPNAFALVSLFLIMLVLIFRYWRRTRQIGADYGFSKPPGKLTWLALFYPLPLLMPRFERTYNWIQTNGAKTTSSWVYGGPLSVPIFIFVLGILIMMRLHYNVRAESLGPTLR